MRRMFIAVLQKLKNVLLWLFVGIVVFNFELLRLTELTVYDEILNEGGAIRIAAFAIPIWAYYAGERRAMRATEEERLALRASATEGLEARHEFFRATAVQQQALWAWATEGLEAQQGLSDQEWKEARGRGRPQVDSQRQHREWVKRLYAASNETERRKMREEAMGRGGPYVLGLPYMVLMDLRWMDEVEIDEAEAAKDAS